MNKIAMFLRNAVLRPSYGEGTEYGEGSKFDADQKETEFFP